MQSIAVIIAFRECNKSRVISRGFWPRRYLHLTLCDFYLGLISKDKVYKTNPHNPEELSDVRPEISTVSREELQSVNSSVFHRYTEFIRTGGQHFQRVILHWWVFIRLSTDLYNTLCSCLHRLLPTRHTDMMQRWQKRPVAAARSNRWWSTLYYCKCTPFVKY